MRRHLDAEINLTPFIDLMAVTIAFLLISAEWTRVGALSVSQNGGHGPGEPSAAVTLRLTGHRVTLPDGSETTAATLSGYLRDAHASAATLVAEDGVLYEDLIAVVDACRAADASVSVSPAAD